MAGTHVGGNKTVEAVTKAYGLDFYRQIGRLGGTVGKSSTKGFAHPNNKGLARTASLKAAEVRRAKAVARKRAKAALRLRDAKGRFIKREVVWYEDIKLEPMLAPVTPKPSLGRWLSHNRLAIILGFGYILLNFLAGAVGGYLGMNGKLWP